ncbi:hypothetical protein [Moorena producens]|uniref:hypothetical protein n=1 Tax=Moorena producens TaxID=1155739 RepID=UPI003C74ABCE
MSNDITRLLTGVRVIPTPDSRLPTPDSRFPTPYSLLPTPYSLLRINAVNQTPAPSSGDRGWKDR